MHVTLKPEAQQFIEEQVRAGRFGSTDEVLQEALERMMEERALELDDETIAAIARAEGQIDRGEGMTFEQFASEARKRCGLT